MALLDLWGRLLKQPVRVLIGAEPAADAKSDAKDSSAAAAPVVRRSFYTAALNPDLDKMVESCQFGLKYSPLLKIKLDNDAAKVRLCACFLTARCCLLLATPDARCGPDLTVGLYCADGADSEEAVRFLRGEQDRGLAVVARRELGVDARKRNGTSCVVGFSC